MSDLNYQEHTFVNNSQQDQSYQKGSEVISLAGGKVENGSRFCLDHRLR